jgi:hypothetical protein
MKSIIAASVMVFIMLSFGETSASSSAPGENVSISGTPAIALATSEAYTPEAPDEIIVVPPEKHDVSPPLSQLTPGPVSRVRNVIPLYRPPRPGAPPFVSDPALQSSASGSATISTLLNFEGVGDSYGVNDSSFVEPPDTNGAAGTSQYVQWVNVDFAVFDKSNGNLLYGPVPGNTLWSGFGGPCENKNGGDPIAQFDKINNKWVMMQIQYPGFGPGGGGYYICLAVSDSNDFINSTFERYAFKFKVLPDYPKLGVWNDGYYITFNGFKGFGAYNGPEVCAFNPAMSASLQCKTLSTSYSSLLPADVDSAGQQPLPGEPQYLISMGSNALWVWRFHVDWNNSRNSFLSAPQTTTAVQFSEACGGGTCIPQSDTSQQLDSLGDRLMYRLAYRNFGSYESLVVNHSVQAYSTGETGIRWYELQNIPSTNYQSPTAPSVYQRDTYAPADGSYRWMGSAAMDASGNISVGYSVSSSGMHPDIRIASRCSGDTLGLLGTEVEMLPGFTLGSQLTTNRWGDYAGMSVDPDGSLWFTTEYLATDGDFNWHTRIFKFTISGCP